MNIDSQLSLSPLSLLQKSDISLATTKIPPAEPLQTSQVIDNKRVVSDLSQIHLSDSGPQMKALLTEELQKYSPQDAYQKYDAAVDNRVKIYLDNGTGKKEPYEVFVDQATRQVNYGKAQGEGAEKLNQLMGRITQGAERAHSETRNILSALGKLDPSTESYISESQTYTRFALDELGATIEPDEKFIDTKQNTKAFSLQVTTRDGDEISVNIQQSSGWNALTLNNQVAVQYQVDGDLSESEQEALTQLMDAIGAASDGLLAGQDLTDIMGIAAFNGEQLADFSLSLEGSGQSIDYSYSLDGDKQKLQGDWVQNGAVKAEFSLSSKIGGFATESELTQYLDLIDQAADVSYRLNDNKDDSNQSSGLFKSTLTDFMQLAETLGTSLNNADHEFTQSRSLANDLFTKMNKQQDDRLGLKDEQQANLKEGFNQLADFSANFVAQGGGSRETNTADAVTGYNLGLSQKTIKQTQHTDETDQQQIKQTRSVTSDAVMGGIANERDFKLNEEYTIAAVIDDFSLHAIKQHREVKETLNEDISQGWGESRFLHKMRESQTDNNIYFLKEGVLESSKQQGGETIKHGFKAGDYIVSQLQSEQTYDYNAEQFTRDPQEYRADSEIALSIASQKRLLDSLLGAL